MIWYVCNGRYESLMCTSNVAGNTQMASLERQVTQNGLGVINAIARGMYNGVVEVTVLLYDDDLVAMMSGGVLDVEPFLISRNTLGIGKTANSKSQISNVNGGSGKAVVVAEAQWDCGNEMKGFETQCGSGG